MSILNKLLNIAGLSGDKESAANQDLLVLNHWVEAQGGVAAILRKMHDGQLTDLFTAWLSDRDNLAASKDIITSLFSQESLDDLGHQLGMNTDQVFTLLATWLPKILSQDISSQDSAENNH